MGSVYGDETTTEYEEKIYVAVRLRPLNDREIIRNDNSDWECINSTTVIFKNSLQERSLLPAAYTFDRVFGFNSQTRQVYEEAAKKVALSVLSGMNSTIFAYGQTGSGKTYTMSGITEYAITDIYDYIDKHTERNFVLKFSAMEIYNEAVKDPLRPDTTTQLRLLDDPERGTIVDKLTEVKLRDSNHLRELLSICAAQRQIGETSLNEQSSRSHQILRLTVESEARHYLGAGNSSTLTAAVNFVDLAGSERASQTLSAGARLKEGCHINRSLLTLGTVIRKLSKGGRNGHIPYRDSKLTRILQNSLGGNARTAIICTMSPAHSHVEQSRNTLHFANCAKQVSTNAQVNVVMSEKALVKQLQKELARLGNELKTLTSQNSLPATAAAIYEKELLIQKMEQEIKDLTLQRDQAHARVEDILRECQTPQSWVYMHSHDRGSWTDEYSSPSEASDVTDPLRLHEVSSRSSHLSEIPSRVQEEMMRYSEASPRSPRLSDIPTRIQEEHFLSDDTSPRQYIDKYFGPDPCQGWEKNTMQQTKNNFDDNTSNVREVNTSVSTAPSPRHARAASTASAGKSPLGRNDASAKSKSCEAIPTTVYLSTPPRTENIIVDEANDEEKLPQTQTHVEILHKNNDSQHSLCLNEEDEEKPPQTHAEILHKNNDSQQILHKNNDSQQILHENHDSQQILHENNDSQQILHKNNDSQQIQHKNNDSQHSLCLNEEDEDEEAAEEKEQQEEDDEDGDDYDIPVANCVKQVIESKPVDLGTKAEEMEDGKPLMETKQSADSDWSAEFDKQKREIIRLWDACRSPLLHRTYFHLLFKGDPSDAVYLEVELRRLSFLKNSLNATGADDASSIKELTREREMLCRKLFRKYSTKEREEMYIKWGINVKSKQRRMQLCRKLWSDTTNMEHVHESASVIAKLMDFKEQAGAPKEMFGLSLLPKQSPSRTFTWKPSII